MNFFSRQSILKGLQKNRKRGKIVQFASEVRRPHEKDRQKREHVAEMRRTRENYDQKRQNVSRMRRPHENVPQKRQNVSRMLRPHENDTQKRQHVTKTRLHDKDLSATNSRFQGRYTRLPITIAFCA